jgi:hypothetical protein
LFLPFFSVQVKRQSLPIIPIADAKSVWIVATELR